MIERIRIEEYHKGDSIWVYHKDYKWKRVVIDCSGHVGFYLPIKGVKIVFKDIDNLQIDLMKNGFEKFVVLRGATLADDVSSYLE